jgi:4-diphosphocytidyl-2-C-methyl-D-erythritol kinase
VPATRLARADEIPILGEIESLAAELFVGWVDAEHTAANVPPCVLYEAQAAGRLFVATDESDRPVGFAVVIIVEGAPHLEELDVVPAHGRKGHGSRLVEAVCGWAVGLGHRSLTLSTYIDVPWNAPFYRRRGFREVLAHERTSGLERVLEIERQKGFPMERRVLMRRELLVRTSPVR